MQLNIKGIEIEIKSCEGVYPPSEDSFILAESIRDEDIEQKEILEIGTGTGLIAILCAKLGAKKVTATDIKARAVECAKNNAHLNDVQIEALVGDIFEPVKNRRFDTIIFNPPYLPSDPIYDVYLDTEDKLDLIGGEHGIEVAVRFIRDLKKYLREAGSAYLVISSLGELKILYESLKRHNLRYQKVASVNYGGEEIIVLRLWRPINADSQ